MNLQEELVKRGYYAMNNGLTDGTIFIYKGEWPSKGEIVLTLNRSEFENAEDGLEYILNKMVKL